jgi:hypothetical protein
MAGAPKRKNTANNVVAKTVNFIAVNKPNKEDDPPSLMMLITVFIDQIQPHKFSISNNEDDSTPEARALYPKKYKTPLTPRVNTAAVCKYIFGSKIINFPSY